MLSLSTCKTVLNKGEKKFSDMEAEKIRTLFYQLAEIEFECYKLEKDSPLKMKN
jgi:hypothetical protein